MAGNSASTLMNLVGKIANCNNIAEVLPTVYKPTNGEIKYRKKVIRFLQKLKYSDRKITGNVIGKIYQLCRLGKDEVSLEIKTMDEETRHSPINALQVSLNDFRLTFALKDGNVVFYDMYHRKDTPYGTCRN